MQLLVEGLFMIKLENIIKMTNKNLETSAGALILKKSI